MRPHVLRVTAFGAFGGTAEVCFDDLADSGLFLLHGETGAGKTTLLDAIGFALYGRVPGDRGKVRRLRSDHAEAGVRTEVQLVATIGGRRLRITRSPEQERPKQRGSGMTTEPAKVLLEEEAGTKWDAKSTRAGEADAEIADLMGMSAEQFFQVVLLPQGQFARFLQAGAEERGKLLQRLFGTDRFRAVEEWLAERRRSTARAVDEARQGIDKLGARIAQVAGIPAPGEGDADADGADLPTTAWAADLTAMAAAESERAGQLADTRKRELDVALEAQREAEQLANRQRRRAEALRRRDELSVAQPVIGGLRLELEAAARAAEIAPAIGQAERAADAVVAARTAEDAARAAAADAGVPGPAAAGHPDEQLELDAEPEPAQLADAAHFRAETEARQQLVGRLEGLRELAEQAEAEDAAARKATDRAAELAAEIVGCDDEITRQRAERAALVLDRDAALAATQRLPEVRADAQRHRRGADAAVALDAARADERRLSGEHLRAREEAVRLRENAQQIREARFDGMVAELAEALIDKTPCPVCGALDHPDPSEIKADRVTHEEEEQATAKAEAARDQVEKISSDLAAVRARAEDASARLADAGFAGLLPAGMADHDDGTTAAVGVAAAGGAADSLGDAAVAIAARATALEAEALELDIVGARLAELQDALTQLDAASKDSEKRRSALAEQRTAALDQAAGAHDRAAAQRASLLAQLGGAPDLQTAFAAARGAATAAAAAASAIEVAALAAEDAGRAGDAGLRAAIATGFADAAAAKAAVREPAWRAAQQERIAAHDREAAAVQDLLTDPELDVLLDPPADMAGTATRLTDARDTHEDAVNSHGRATDRARQLAELAPELNAGLAALEPLTARADEARRLADLAAGQGSNRLKMTLSSFVLAARLEEVAATASERLLKMTAGRYSLAHTDAVRGGGRAGLGLLACDAWTGVDRDTSTLSGGETFLASLALALGLADVVTAEAAGTRLEALFVDEGFGSLDEDTLDEVMNVLDSLREGGRLVGIVSHVTELRQRVPAQIHVTKSRTGSRVTITAA